MNGNEKNDMKTLYAKTWHVAGATQIFMAFKCMQNILDVPFRKPENTQVMKQINEMTN